MRLGFIRLRTSLALFWESFWRAFWPFFAGLGLVMAAFLTDLFPRLHWLVHIFGLVLCAVALVYLLIRGFRRFQPNSPHARDRRIETDSGLKHRPLTSLHDENVLSQNNTLWHAHRLRVSNALSHLRAKPPSPGVPSRDLKALRAIPLILLAITVPVAWGDVAARLGRAVKPNLPTPEQPAAFLIDAWVSPPVYTGIAPFVLKMPETSKTPETAKTQDKTLAFEAPAGSGFLLQVQGGDRSPSIWSGGEELAFNVTTRGAFRYETRLTAGPDIRLVRGVKNTDKALLLNLKGTLIEDTPPTVLHGEDPRTTDAGSLKLSLKGEDDYGFERLTLRLEPGEERDITALEALYQVLSIGVPGRSPKEFDFSEFLDLAAHPFAGQTVKLTVTATDYARQKGTAEVKELTLPVYVFDESVSKELARLRMQLFARPERAGGVGAALETLSEHPDLVEDKYKPVRDLLNGLAKRLANQQIEVAAIRPPADENIQNDAISLRLQALDEISRTLWDLARRLDDNPIKRAEELIRKLEEQLREALERDAPEEELMALMEKLREAMDAYKQAVIAEKLAQMLEDGNLNINRNNPGSDAMEDLAQRLEDMARKGGREQALKLLDELKEMMENLRDSELELSLEGQGGEGGVSPTQQMLNELSEIMTEQQGLLNNTFRQQQERMQPDRGRDRKSSLQQETLRRRLGKTMRNFSQMFDGEIPDGLGQAERAMKEATRGLFDSNRNRTIAGQSRALNELQKSAQSLSEMMRQRAEQRGENSARGQGQGQGEGEGQGQGKGRGSGGPGGDGSQSAGPGGDQQNGGGPGGDQPGGQGSQQGEGQQYGQGKGSGEGQGTDPLGRSYGDGHPLDLSPDSAKKLARGIRDELRRRAGEPDRSELERSYIENLLKEF